MTPASPSEARRALLREVGLRLEPTALSNALLLTSEIVTAIVVAAAPGELELEVELADEDLRVVVHRREGDRAMPVTEPEGFGREILERLADRWGTRGASGEPSLWFELRAAARRAQHPPAERRAAAVVPPRRRAAS